MDQKEIDFVDVLVFIRNNFRSLIGSLVGGILICYCASYGYIFFKGNGKQVSLDITVQWVDAFENLTKRLPNEVSAVLSLSTFGKFFTDSVVNSFSEFNDLNKDALITRESFSLLSKGDISKATINARCVLSQCLKLFDEYLVFALSRAAVSIHETLEIQVIEYRANLDAQKKALLDESVALKDDLLSKIKSTEEIIAGRKDLKLSLSIPRIAVSTSNSAQSKFEITSFDSLGIHYDYSNIKHVMKYLESIDPTTFIAHSLQKIEQEKNSIDSLNFQEILSGTKIYGKPENFRTVSPKPNLKLVFIFGIFFGLVISFLFATWPYLGAEIKKRTIPKS